MSRYKYAVALTFAVALASSAPMALAIDKIYSPNVVRHELEIEYSGARTFSGNPAIDNAQSHEFEFEYTPTDRFKLELEGVYEKEPDGKLIFEGREIGGIYQFFETGEKWADVALKVMYADGAQKGSGDAIEAKLLVEKQTGYFLHRMNIGLEKPLTAHSEADRSFLWNTRYLYNEHFNPGLEIQSDLGTASEGRSFNRQEHYVGPGAYGTIVPGLKYEVAYFWGMSRPASRNAARLLLEYERYF